MLRSLFIGIDRYPSPVTRLSCACADALALSTLLADNFEGNVATLLDDEATLAGLRSALADLKRAHEDDLVVVGFSGHGTPDHRIVPVDVDPDRLAATCMSLQELAEALDAIPAKQLIVVLDCCFSGGFGGARVFAPTTTRDMHEDRSSLARLARGDGRVVITASGASEPALETAQYGHGLLTYHLLQGLQGKDELASTSRFSLLELFNFVISRVLDAATSLGETQTPTVYGSVEGLPTLRALLPGERYTQAFPSRVRPPVNDSWASLAPYGLPDEVIGKWAAAMPRINDLQQQSINHFGVLDGRSLVVSAPTAAGKTMIGELAAVRAAISGSRAVFLLPLKALVEDKYEYFTRTYGDMFSVVRATGDHNDDIGAIFSGQYDLALLTYEMFRNMAVGSPFIMRGISLVVVDEVQTIGDPTRGSSLEFLMTLLRSGHARGGAPQIVALSAVIGDTNDFERWLGAGLLKTTERPVPLRETVIDASGGARHLAPDGSIGTEPDFVAPEYVVGGEGNKQLIIPLVRQLVNESKKVIVFRVKRGQTVGAAGYLADALGLAPATDALSLLPDGDRSDSSNSLRQALQGGVGFHNADLDRDERAAIETSLRDPNSPLRVVVATTTLAMGVNTSAEAVIVVGLTHPGGSPYTVAEYKNMVGRAGRPGYGDTGEAYLLATSDIGDAEAWHRYVLGDPEPLESRFLDGNTDSQTLVLRSLAVLGSSVPENELVELLDNSFAVWLLRDQGTSEGWDRGALAADVQALVEAGLLDREPNGNLTLTELGRFAGSSGFEVRSIVQVSSALRFAPPELSFADLVVLAQVTVELDALYLPMHTKSSKERLHWPPMLLNRGVSRRLFDGMHVGGGDTGQRTKRAAGCLLFASSAPLARIEQELMQHLRERAAAGQLRQVASRTRDVIDAVVTVARVRGHGFSEEALSENIGLRLEIGLPNESLELARLIGSRLTRSSYLALLGAGVTDIEGLRSLAPARLIELIGATEARRINHLRK